MVVVFKSVDMILISVDGYILVTDLITTVPKIFSVPSWREVDVFVYIELALFFTGILKGRPHIVFEMAFFQAELRLNETSSLCLYELLKFCLNLRVI